MPFMYRIGSLVFFLSYFGFLIRAQPVISEAISPQAGDTLLYAFDDQAGALDIGTAGAAQDWDFQDLSARVFAGQNFEAIGSAAGGAHFPAGQLYGTSEEGVETFYRSFAGQWQVLGFYGVDPLSLGIQAAMKYHPPLVEWSTPMFYLDSAENQTALGFAFAASDLPDSIISVLPIQPDSIRFTVEILRKDIVDAWGNLRLPSMSADVLRLRRLTIAETKLEAKVSFLGWQDISPIVNSYFPELTLAPDTSLSYHFFHDMTKQAIAICRMDNSGEVVQNVQFQDLQLTSVPPLEANLSFAIDFYPNPVRESLWMNVDNIPPGSYTVRVFNLLGVLVLERHVNLVETQKVLTLDFTKSGLGAGTYGVQLLNTKQNIYYAEKILFTP